MNALKFKGRDYVALSVTVAFIAGVILLNIYCGEFNAEFTFNATV